MTLGLAGASALAVFAFTYVLIATERIHRVAAALGGAAVVLALGLTDAEAAFYSESTGVDWNVVFLLLGMMVIVGVLRQTGLFEALAILASKAARGRPYPVMALLVVITAVASALLDNVTTVLLVAPVTFLVCERLDLDVKPYLIAEVLASNIGGTATLVGDPPNIIIASRAGLTFNDFLVHLLPFAAAMTVVLLGLCRVLFRRAFVHRPERVAEVMALSEREAIRDPRLLVQSLLVLALVLAGFVLHPVLHYEPSVVALLGAGVLVALTPVTAEQALDGVEWETLAFFVGLFVLVGSLVETGVIGALADRIGTAAEGRFALTAIVLLLGSLVLSGLVDNIPYVATMAPVVAALPAAGSHDHALWWSLALGADLGGNATAVGASANVVVLGLAKRYGAPISFWEFTRYGLVVTAVSGALATAYVALRYLA